MPRDEKGRYTKEETGFYLSLPSPFSILKYLIICLLLFPWYKLLNLLSNKFELWETITKMMCNCNCKIK